jgi:hypothetical protein
VCLAALFHKTAVLLLPFVFFATAGSRMIVTMSLALISLGVVAVLMAAQFPFLVDAYFHERMESAGGLVRVAMTASCGACLLLFNKQLLLPFAGKDLWTACAIISLVALIFAPFFSTLVDRSMLYLAPMTMVFFGRLPNLFGSGSVRLIAAAAALMLQASVLWTWLNFADHRDSWIPYRMFPFSQS